MKARDLGIPFEGTVGENNAITDVEGVLVGHSTIIDGEGDLIVGKGPIRTGVTAVFPCGKNLAEVYSGYFSYNGNGEMTGTAWIEESGLLKGPICITNTHSVGTVRDAIIKWIMKNDLAKQRIFWSLPVVAETYDGLLNDINGFHIKDENVFDALDTASYGQVIEGNVGGGTGMVCHQFKGGIGTSSRVIDEKHGGYTVGVLAQANYGLREHLTVAGVPVGIEMKNDYKPKFKFETNQKQETGSIIVIVATNAPLLPIQLRRLAKRVSAGLARVGGYGGNYSGDIFLAFSTANIFEDGVNKEEKTKTVVSLDNKHISSLFKAVAEATEEAIVNALVNAETMEGINGNIVYSLPHEPLIDILIKYNRLEKV
ncbi:MAG: P1 family peptidase [Candidatus Heimdallarchaeota archaeon]|nr:P1 family peptidase [Candidatus Heimdallarchaeota archaeon]